MSNCLIMLYISTKFCHSISWGFRFTDLNSRVEARVVANDGQTYGLTDGKLDLYIAPCLRQAGATITKIKLDQTDIHFWDCFGREKLSLANLLA